VDGAALVLAGRKATLDRRGEARAAVGDDEERRRHPPVGEERDPGVCGLARARGEAHEDGSARGVDAPGDEHGLGCGLRVHLHVAAVQIEVVDA